MRLLTAMAFGVAVSATAALSQTAPQDVQADDYGAVAASLTGTAGNPEEGAVIMKTKKRGNCISCHQVTALQDAPFHGEVGPSLDGAGSRWEEADLRGILVNSKNVFPGTIMPAYYKVEGYVRPGVAFTKKPATEPLPPLLSASDIEDVVAFLMTLKED